jgi:hypothetical protein
MRVGKKRMKNQSGILLAVAIFIFTASSVSRADNLFRVFPETQLDGFYGDNIPLKTNNEIGDFGSTMVFGFYLDYTSAARYISLHYDTFVQLFTHQTELDRAGEGQFVNATDDENISPTTKLHVDDLFYRDASAVTTITTSDQSPQFNSVLALLLLANDQASINQFNAQLQHYWEEKWSSEFSVHQTTFFATDTNSTQDSYSFAQSATAATDYHFSGRFSLGLGYRFYDWRFTFPGQPGEQAHWPFARGTWQATKNIYVSGMVGVAISHTQGQGTEVNPAGIGLVEYTFPRGTVSLSGGQEPSLTSAFGTVGYIRGFRGNVLYYFTPRLTGSAGGSFYDATGSGFSGEFASWGVGVTQRVNRWLSINGRFIQIRRTETTSNQFLPSGTENGEWAVGDYYIIGLAVSFEAFRWSWR